jgi:hypothetical protein
MEHTESRTAFRLAVSYKGCIVQEPIATWAQISTPRFRRNQIFDFEAELLLMLAVLLGREIQKCPSSP